MPGGDRTGPMGMGPMSGRAMGFCAGYDRPGYANDFYGYGNFGGWRGGGRGFGRGRGWRGGGRGFRHQYYATGLTGWQRDMGPYGSAYMPAPMVTGQQELEMLRQQAQSLTDGLQQINERIAQLEQDQTEKK